MKKVVGYIRVSSEQQKTEGISLDMQIARIREYASAKGLFLAGIYGDPGISAKNISGRPGFQAVLHLAASQKIDSVIVYKLDRAFRNTVEGLQAIATLKCQHCGLDIVDEGSEVKTDSANDELMLTLKLSISQWERRVIGERTRAALAQKKAEGCYLGAVPFGFCRNGDCLTEDPNEQVVLSVIANLAQAGMSYRQIAIELNSRGYHTKRGTAWTHIQVSRAYKRAA